MVTVIAITGLMVYFWRVGLTRAAEISGVGALIVAIVTPIAPFLWLKGTEGQERAPAMTAASGPAAVSGSAHAQAAQAGGSSEEPSGAQQRPVRTTGAPPALNDAISRVLDLLIAAHLSKTESEQIAYTVGIDVSGVSWAEGPRPFWWHVVNRAQTAWIMEILFEAADHVFGGNPEWTAAKQDYLTARDG